EGAAPVPARTAGGFSIALANATNKHPASHAEAFFFNWPPSIGCSERILHRDLQLPRTVHGVGDRASRTRHVHSVVWKAKFRRVEKVERLPAQLQSLILLQSEVLEHGEIH